MLSVKLFQCSGGLIMTVFLNVNRWPIYDPFLFFADTNYISLLASGPYGLIFASFVPFFLDIPVTSQFRIFGLSFSNKSFIYLVGLQVSLLPYSIFVIYLFILSDHIVSFSPCSFFYLLGSVPLFLVYLVWLLVLFIV
jgi:hypothetical protein